ncbi:MAG: hypothetical protein P1R58_03530 [bacterium]|nr:hypothetical protein [bacterium]
MNCSIDNLSQSIIFFVEVYYMFKMRTEIMSARAYVKGSAKVMTRYTPTSASGLQDS